MDGWDVDSKLIQKRAEVILHVRLNDPEAKLQQETIGVLGTNLIHGCFHHYDNRKSY